MIYSMISADECTEFNANILILGDAKDERAMALAQEIQHSKNKIDTIVRIKYDKRQYIEIEKLFPKAKIIDVQVNNTCEKFLQEIKEIKELFNHDIIIDISCIHIPEMFILFKYFAVSAHFRKIKAAYTIPFDYAFFGEPFTSYTSYYGDLKTTNLIGFGGVSDGEPHSKMVVFMGFEGVLSSKVIEDIQFKELVLVNNLPSYFPKYKDIGVINHFDLISTRNKRVLYVPANNPFEVYNFLDDIIKNEKNICVAPLSTKPVALGVCLYALKHTSVRVVYPVSLQYTSKSTNNIMDTYLYDIPMSNLK